MGVTPRILRTNLVLAAASALTSSSEDPGFPVLNLKDQARGRRWRSKVGWPVVAGLRDEVSFLTATDNVKRIGHVVPGVYATGAAYATAVTAAMAAAGSSPVGLSASGWWRSDHVTLDANGLVSGMTDLSGNGRNLSQAVAGARPLWVANAIDGRPGMYFDGVSKQLTSTATMATFLGASGVGTIVAVFKLDSDAGASDVIFFAGSGSEFLIFQWSGTTNFQSLAHDTTTKTATKAAPSGVGAWHHGTWYYDLTNLGAFVDDSDAAAVAVQAMTGALHANIMASGFSLGNTIKGYLVEAAIFPSALSQESRRRHVAYLKGRYPSMAASDTTTAPAYTDVVTVTYDASTKKFTTARTAGAGNVTLHAATAVVPAAQVYKNMGYTVAVDKTGAATYTENAAYQGAHWLKVDLGAAAAVLAGVALDHNSGASGGTWTVEGNAADLWVAPTLSEALAGDASQRSDYWASSSLRWWRLLIDDVQNAAGYAEVGVWYIGTYDDVPSYSPAFSRGYEDLSVLQYADHGAGYGDERPQRGVWNLYWRNLLDSQKATFEAFQEATPRSKAFFLLFDAATLTSIRYGHRPDPLLFVHNEGSVALWNMTMVFVEALP